MLNQVILIGALALGSYAQSSSSSSSAFGGSSTTGSPVAAQTTVRLYVDAELDQGFVGSVIAADSCGTTYALYCTEGDYGSGILSTTCDPNKSARVTHYGSTSVLISTQIETAGAEATLLEDCSLAGTTEAVCTASVSLSANGKHTAEQTVVTRTGSDVHYFDVPITAGASKLSNLAACTKSDNAAPAATGAVDIIKVLVVPGAAALLAGYNAFA